jgi:hypothetical protein
MPVLQNGNDPIDDVIELFCSFCGKSQSEVIKMIAGPHVYICNECIMLCVEILEEEDAPGFEGRYDSLRILERLQAIKTLDQGVFLHACTYINGLLVGLPFRMGTAPENPPAAPKSRRRGSKK